jgi:hypothetical protein
MATQKEEIKKYLEKGNSITPIEALVKFGSFRLAAVIWDLREEGMTILTETVDGPKNKYAKYRLITEDKLVEAQA